VPAKPAAAPTTAPAAKPAEAKPADTKPAASPAAQPAAKAAASPAAKPALSKAEGAAFDEKAVADFYRGKTVRIIVGHGVGGGFDVWSRAIARHLGKYVPGNPTVIVENMPEAGGMVAANNLYNVAPKDGTVLANVIGGIARSQLLGDQGVQYDASKLRFIGAVTGENSVLMVTRASGVSSFEDMLDKSRKPVALGDSGAATTNHNAAVLTKEVLGANIKVVTGYEGTPKVELAIEQGELDGQFNDWASNRTRTPQKFESGEWLLIGQLTDRPLTDLPRSNVPMLLNYAKDDEQRQLLRFGIIVPNQFTRPFFLPPGVPPDRAAALEEGFAKTIADKDFLTDAEKAKLVVSWTGGVEVQKLITEYLAMSPDLKTKLLDVLSRK
jgi:tripartite-type tricarboxylate transporter receptor subunit TctC